MDIDIEDVSTWKVDWMDIYNVLALHKYEEEQHDVNKYGTYGKFIHKIVDTHGDCITKLAIEAANKQPIGKCNCFGLPILKSRAYHSAIEDWLMENQYLNEFGFLNHDGHVELTKLLIKHLTSQI